VSRWRVSVQLALGALDLRVDLEGEDGPLALMGPNGSGKTTLLRAIAGAVPAAHAEVSVGSRVLESTSRGVRRPIEERRIGYVPQGYGLFPHLSAAANIAFGLTTGRRGLSRHEALERATALLTELGCGPLADRRVDQLSGGERQRVALARALVLEPELLLLDEPLAALDPTNRRRVRGFLADHLRSFGRPSLVVTHDPKDVEALGGRLAIMDAGRVVQQGTLAEIRSSPATEMVAELVGACG